MILTLNAGSSSIKFALFDGGDAVATGIVEELSAERRLTVNGTAPLRESWVGHGAFHADALGRVLRWLRTAHPSVHLSAVGHRVVHGGLEFAAPAIVDDAALARLEALVPLAPLHQPHNLAGIRAAYAAFPGVPQVACFDTAFHRAQPFVNDVFAIPRRYYEAGVRRYGFHGLSYEYVAGRLRQIAPHHAAGRVAIAHLGNGASMCALRDGMSVASTMGFTALDGLPMGTRCGQIDPGVLLYLMQHDGMTADQVSDLLYKESGLKGLSGVSHDMREIAAADTPAARQAIDVFAFRVKREFGAMAAVLEGLDAIAFCGGIGENARDIRARVLEGMEWIGVELDPERNRMNETVVSSDRSRVRVFVIRTDEEAMIARHTASVVAADGPAAA
jgi:acetate kinase